MCFRCIETRYCYVTGCDVVAALSFIVATGVDGRLSLLRGGGMMVVIPTETKA
jgi:hypothetical protein